MMNNYKMRYDHHTHTVYSHGKGTIEDNVKRAIEVGLEEIAITDHGLRHLTYGMKKEDIPKMRAEIEGLRKKYSEIKIHMSIEANIVRSDTWLDMTDEEVKEFDFIIAGYHFGVRDADCIKNFIFGRDVFSKFEREKMIRANTDMVLNCINRNKIRILAHPGDKAPVYIREVAEACYERGTLMEISSRHRQLTLEQLDEIKDIPVRFCISSDAHLSENVGLHEEALKRAFKAGIDVDRIDNIFRV